MTTDVAIQIVNYKTKAFLEPLVASIVKDIEHSGLAVDINILDNASGDNLEQLGQKWRNQRVHIYTSAHNGGFGAGHNTLARKTKAPYLLILNPDMLFFEPHTIERLLETSTRTGAAVVGPRLLTPKSRVHTKLGEVSADQLKQQPWDHGKRGIWRYHLDNQELEVVWVSGAAFLIRHDVFKAVGGFDDKFFLYFEEVDLCYRLRRLGEHVIYNPKIQLIHYGNAVARKRSSYTVRSFIRLQLKRSSLIFR